MTKKYPSIIELILSAIALTIAVLILLKAWSDLDTNYDVGWYHLPFAARIWGIVPAKSFLSEKVIEYRYQGFPLLAHFFQGLLWKLTGRIQATNLVGYLSLIIYFCWLRAFFRVPLYLSAIAIFTIPAVLTHASTSMVDLPGNVGAAVLMMAIYRFFAAVQLPTKGELLAAVLGAIVAANTKPQLQPLVFVLYWVAIARLIWLYFKYTTLENRRLWRTMVLAAIVSTLIFATPIKNVVQYGNPFYPVKIEVAGIVLNHKLTPETYSAGNRPQKWLQSILEINTPAWTTDQWNKGDETLLDRGGGFFGAYVVFNLLFLVALTIKERIDNRKLANPDRSRQALTALVTILLVSLIPANFPQSHELRYFMFWMVTLVSLNLSLISSTSFKEQWLQPRYVGLVYVLFLALVCTKINRFYLKPDMRSLEEYLSKNVKQELVEQMQPNRRNCTIARHAVANLKAVPFASINTIFYYSDYFHPELGYSYGIKAAIEPSACGNLRMIPPNAAEFIKSDSTP